MKEAIWLIIISVMFVSLFIGMSRTIDQLEAKQIKCEPPSKAMCVTLEENNEVND